MLGLNKYVFVPLGQEGPCAVILVEAKGKKEKGQLMAGLYRMERFLCVQECFKEGLKDEGLPVF